MSNIQNLLQSQNHTFTNANLQGGVALSQSVNSGNNLLLGSCCASKIDFSLLDLELAISGLEGEEFEYRCNGELKGYFTAEKPEKVNDSGWRLTCYDRMTKFDRTVNEWMEGIEYPITLKNLLISLCGLVGIGLETQSFTNEDFLVYDNFSGKDIKGRDFLSWIAEAAGCFARINAAGNLELDFYKENDRQIDRSKYQSISVSDYATKPIEKVQIKQNDDDIGVITGTGSTCYAIVGNPLFYARESEILQPAAEAILEKIEGFTYTPFECELISGSDTPEVGEYVSITTRRETNVKSIVMNKQVNGLKTTVSSVGEPEQTELQSVNRSILVQNGRTNELERTLEQTVLRMRDVYNKAETESVAKQTASDAMLEFSKSGGDNLVHNGGFIHGKTSWEFSSEAVCSVKADSSTSSKNALVLESGEAVSAELIRVIPGADYAVYFKYKAAINSGGSASILFGDREILLPATGTADELSSASYEEIRTTGQEESPYVMAFDSKAIAVRIKAENAIVQISDLTLVEGTVCTAFSLAPGESRTSSVAISDEGIRIERTGGQFRGLYTDSEVHYTRQSDGSTVARFSADGAETGALTVTGSATVQRNASAARALRIIPAANHVKFVIND